MQLRISVISQISCKENDGVVSQLKKAQVGTPLIVHTIKFTKQNIVKNLYKSS